MDASYVAIPGGAFLMGSEAGQDDERPIHRVHLDAFQLSTFPVTRRQYAAFLTATGISPGSKATICPSTA